MFLKDKRIKVSIILFTLLFVAILLKGLTGYVYAFSIPKNNKVNKSKKMDKEAYHNGITISLATPSAECGICHQKEFHEWRYATNSDLDSIGKGTYHALSSTEEMYKKMLNGVPSEFHIYCKGCHESGNAWAVEDKVSDIPEPRSENINEGINCVVCHYDGDRMVSKNEFKDPLFCATCHNAGDSITDTYIEWLNDYKDGKTCQKCHMKKDSHTFPGVHSSSLTKDAISISELIFPDHIVAGVPFDIQFNLTNYGAGHSVPASILRKLRIRVSIADSSNVEVNSHEKDFYKRFTLFGEVPSETEVIKAGETKQLTFQGSVYSAGIYTLKVELFQDLNRLGIMNSTILMGAQYKTFTVK